MVCADPLHTAPIFDLRVRKAVRRNGTALAVATERPSALDGGATEVERIPVGGAAAWLAELAAAIRDGSEDGIAGLLRGAADVVIVWGERILRGPRGEDTAAALVAISDELGLATKPESGMIELPEVANARGLAEAGCLPDSGPGLAPVTPGRDVDGIRAGLESGEIEAVILYGVDPLRDFPDTEGWRRALERAGHVVSFTMASTATTDLADVVFPLESHAEKDGTVTHPEGRIQRVRPSAARPGEIQAGWHVLAELAAALGHETGIHSSVEALAALADAVPFYAGLDHAEIGGQGVRWQDRPQAEAWTAPVEDPAGRPSPGAPSEPPTETDASASSGGEGGSTAAGALTLGTYRDIWADETTDLSPALNFLIPAQRLELSVADADRLGFERGDEVTVRDGDTEVDAFVSIRSALPEGTCFLIEGTREGNANVFLDGEPALVEIGKASPRLDVVAAGNGSEGGEA